MPDYIGPALRNLSDTLYKGLSGIGDARLKDAELALKGAEVTQRIQRYREEAPKRAMELITARTKAREELEKDTPFNVQGLVENDLVPASLLGNQPPSAQLRGNVKMFGAQLVPKLGKAFGEDVEYDPAKKVWYHQGNGIPVTKREVEKNHDALSGLIMMHTDGDKYLQMLAEEGNPHAIRQVQAKEEDPLSYQRYQLETKQQIFDDLRSRGFGEKALKPAYERLQKEMERYDKLAGEVRTETRTLEREDRSEARALEREGRTEGRALARENRVEDRALAREDRKSDIEKVPSAMRDFELTNFGKEVPDLRGTDEYKKSRLDYIKETTGAKQSEVVTKRQADNLRKEFYNAPDVKNAIEIGRQFGIAKEGMEEAKTTKNFIATDQALINTLNKMVDPQGTVRIEEYRRTKEDQALINRVRGYATKVLAGGAGLTPSDREALFRMEERITKAAEKGYKAKHNEYKGYLSNYNVDPDQYLKPYNLELSGGATSGPSKSEWLDAARKANPGTSDADLESYYSKKYGGK